MFLLLVAQVAFLSGCTSAVWDKRTFAHDYRPAIPSNLRLCYSKARTDLLVQYDERREQDGRIVSRCFWLEPNTPRINSEVKPRFVSSKQTDGLEFIPVSETRLDAPPVSLNGLYAVARGGDDFFMLYFGNEQTERYKLPVYRGRSQRVKQVLLTPFAVAVDITIIGAIIGAHVAPSFLPGLNR